MKVAVLLTDHFEDSEYLQPVAAFRQAGHQVITVGLATGATVRGKKRNTPVLIDREVAEAAAAEFDALLIPGGHSPDTLRRDRQAVAFANEFMVDGKPVFAICHGPLILLTARAVTGRKITGWKSIAQEITDAGGIYLDQQVVVDDNLVSSRRPADLPAFIAACLAKLWYAGSSTATYRILDPMAEHIPQDIRDDLEKAARLHQRASSDFEKCQEFNQLMSDLLGRLEDAGCHRTAGRVMGILIDCNPKQGCQCDKATQIGEKMKKLP